MDYLDKLNKELDDLSNHYYFYEAGVNFVSCTHCYGPARKYAIKATALRENQHITDEELKQTLVQIRKAIKEHKPYAPNMHGITDYIRVDVDIVKAKPKNNKKLKM